MGSAESGIVFVGEAPGADEDRRGEPFVGRAGELLTRIIQAMDDAQLIPGVPLRRDTVYICNVLKCRPPENRNPLPHEVEACAPYLERQLEALQPARHLLPREVRGGAAGGRQGDDRRIAG